MRLAMFGAMGAMLIASFAVPDAFGDDAFLFACAYAIVRIAHLVLYAVAGRGDRELLAAVARLGVGSAIGVGLLFVAAALDGKRAGRRLGDRARLRPPRPVRRPRARLAPLAGPLRRAARAHRDHRARRVDRRARRRRNERSRRRRHRRRSPRLRRCGLPLVGVLRRGRDRRRAPPDGDGGERAARDGAGFLQLSPPADGRRDHPLRRRGEEDDGPRGRPARSSCPAVALCGGVAMYLARARALPAPQRPLPQSAASRRQRRAGRAGAGSAWSCPPSRRSRSSPLSASA